MRSIFGLTIFKVKDMKQLIKIVKDTQNNQAEIMQHVRNLNDTFGVNTSFSNSNFKKHFDKINELTTRVNDIEKKLFIIVKNN